MGRGEGGQGIGPGVHCGGKGDVGDSREGFCQGSGHAAGAED